MKLKELTIHNIASIEDATINFSVDPLRSAEVFAITGDTGAGKTTILDCICLALYNTCPRSENCQEGKVEDNSDNLNMKDPRRLVRRNTSEAEVKLEFQGIDCHDYTARWYVERGKTKKVSNNFSKALWTLTDHNNGNIYTGEGVKITEVQQQIKKAIGLDYNQFTRTTMLPQGQFSEFLKSSEDVKASILAKLINDNFSKIGSRLYDITLEKKKVWEKAKDEASDTGLTQEQIDEKNAQIQILYSDVKSKTNDKDVIDRKVLFLEAKADLEREKKEAEDKFEKAKAVISSKEFIDDELTVVQWNETIDVRASLSKKNGSESKLDILSKEKASLQKEYSDLVGGIAAEDDIIEKEQNLLSEVEAYLDLYKDREEVYKSSQSLGVHLKGIADGRKTISERQERILALKKELDEVLAPAFCSAEEALDMARKEEEAKSSEVSAAQEELDGMLLPKLRARQSGIQAGLLNIYSARIAIKALNEAEKKHQQQKKNLEDRKRSIDENKTKLAGSENAVSTAKGAMDKAEEILGRQKECADDYAKVLRSHLKKGDTCPICGQSILSELPHEDILENLLSKAIEAFDDAKAEYGRKVDERNLLVATIKADEDTYSKELDIFNKDNSVETSKKNALDVCIRCSLDEISSERLDTLGTALADEKSSIEAKIKEGESKENLLKVLRDELTALQRDLSPNGKKQIAVDKARRQKEACESSIRDCKTVIESTIDSVKKSETEVKAKIDEELWQADPAKYAETLEKQAKAYTDKEEEKKNLKDSLASHKNTRDSALKTRGNILSEVKEWESITCARTSVVKDLAGRLSDLYASVRINANRVREAEMDKTEAIKAIGIYLSSHREVTPERLSELCKLSHEDVSILSEKCSQARGNLDKGKAVLDSATNRLEDHLSKSDVPMLEEGETKDSLGTASANLETEINSLNQQIGGLKKVLSDDQAKKKALVEKIKFEQQTHNEYDKWNKVNSLLGDKEGKGFRKIAMSLILGSLLDTANVYLDSLAKRYTLKPVPGSLNIAIEDAYQGFAVRDVDHLSGGETFLVSLALALALAEMGDNLAVDTLFIDEGFGSLSGQPLENAINTLRALNGKNGKHVGVISHREEVKDKIPVQIQVLHSGGESSSVVKVVDISVS